MSRTTKSIAQTTVLLDGKQAESALKAIEDRLESLKEKKKEFSEQGLFADNSVEVAKLDKEIKLVKNTLDSVQKQAKTVSEVIADMAGATENQLGNAYRTLIKQVKNLGTTTQEYADKRKQITLLKDRLDEINGVIKKQEMSWEQVENVISRISTASKNELKEAAKVLEGRISSGQRDGSYDIGTDKQALELINQEIKKIDTSVIQVQESFVDIEDVLKRIATATREEVTAAIKQLEKEIAGADQRFEDVGEKKQQLSQLTAELEKMGGVAKKQEMSLQDVDNVLKNIGKASKNQIREAIAVQEKYVNTLDRTSIEYKEAEIKLKRLRNELNQTTIEGRKQISMWDQIGKTKKRLASYVLVYFGFNKLISGLQKMSDMNIKLSDQLSDIQKTTGLAGKALAELSDDINRIDTRTSVEQLNKLAYEAGKLGLTAKEDVLGFVRAGNQINVALGEDLGEDAIKNIAKLNTVLGVTKNLGVEQGLLATGSAINELGQSSTAAEGYLVDFAKRMGGVASQSKLTIQQVLALGSATDQLGQNVETSATALNKFIITVVSKTEQVAKALKIPLNELKEALNRSTWEGVLMVFQKMSERGGLASLAPIMGDLGSEGARLTAVLTALSANTNILNREIGISNKAFAEATSITNEYNVRNENLAATVEKIGKNIQHWFLGSGIVDWMLNVAIGVEEITRGLGSLDERFKQQLELVGTLTSDIPVLMDQYDKLINSKDPESQEKLKQVIQDIVKIIPSAVAGFDEYGNAIALSTTRIQEFVDQSNANLRRLHQERQKENEKYLNEEVIYLKSLESKQEEIVAKGYFTERNPYGDNRLEMRNKEDIANVTKEYQKQIRVVQELIEERNLLEIDPVDRAGAERHKARIAAEIKQRQELEKLEKETNERLIEETEKEAKKRIDASMKAVDAYLDQQKTMLMKARVEQSAFRGETIDSETKYNEVLEKIEFEGLQKRLDISGLSADKRAEVERQFWDLKLRLFNKEEKETQKYLNELDRLYDQFELKGVSRDQRALIKIQQQYNDAALLLEKALEKKLISEEEYQRQLQILREKEKSAEEQYFIDQGAKDAEKALRQLNEAQSQSELIAAQMRIDGILSESEYKAKLLEIEMEYQAKRLEVAGLTEEQITELKQKNADRQIQAMEQAARKQEQIQQQYADIVKSAAVGIGDSFSKLFEDSADVWKSFGDSMVDVAFDTMMRLVDIWLKEMQAKAIIDTAKGASQEIGTKGLLGVVTAAAIGGIIQGFLKVAQAGIKSLIGKGSSTTSSAKTGQRVVTGPGYSSGGDTGYGRTYEPAGIVHREEYVVPRIVMKDPVAFNHVRVLEDIRRNKYHLQSNPLRNRGFASGGEVGTSSITASQEDNKETVRLNNTLDRLDIVLTKMETNGVNVNYAKLENMESRIKQSRERGSRRS